MKKLRLGLIGLGGRGESLIDTLGVLESAAVVRVADPYADRVASAQEKLFGLTGKRPAGTGDYHEILAAPDVDAVIVSTSWNAHADVAVEAMRAGKYVGLEVGGAYDLEDCWRLVRTHEETGTQLMMLENCCYGERELALLNMVKAGVFGKLVHCEGGYQHDLRGEITRGRQNRHYRFSNFLHRNGELYPTHELGPIAGLLDLNRGNRMLTLCSMASSARGLDAWIGEREPADSDLRQMSFAEGDVVNTLIKCAGGETILLTHDVSLPHPYSRLLKVEGTGGIYTECGDTVFLWDNVKEHCTGDPEEEHQWEPFAPYLEKYGHPLWKKYRQQGVQKGHGGIDFLALSAFAEAASAGAEPPIDVYDAASWMAVTCLSEQSVAMGGHPVPVPDFTRGKWIEARPRPRSVYSLDRVYPELF